MIAGFFSDWRGRRLLSIAVVLLALGAMASAQNITGTVTNATTGRPAAGDDVSLLSLAQGMEEVGSGKTDAQGRFSLAAPANQRTPLMVRVTHDGVNYFPTTGPLMPGTTSTQLTVYDAAKKLDNISQTVEVIRYQTDNGQLQAIALYALRNQSQPPRALADKQTFEFALPAGAVIDSAYAKGPGGQPVNSAADPTGPKNHYAFDFPLRPGETQFQVMYHLPYSGDATISPKPLQEIQHFVVMTPKGMKFEAKNAQEFQPMPDQTGGVMVATNVKPGQDLTFRLSGSGVFADEQGQGEQGGGEAGGATGGQAASNRPGGGLGAPIDAPDPLHDYRAYILGAFALVLLFGGAYVVSKSNAQRQPVAAGVPEFEEPPVASGPAAKAADRSAVFLEAMKEELFQLEVDRQKGAISEEEYVKAKAALDETIRRALARNG